MALATVLTASLFALLVTGVRDPRILDCRHSPALRRALLVFVPLGVATATLLSA